MALQFNTDDLSYLLTLRGKLRLPWKDTINSMTIYYIQLEVHSNDFASWSTFQVSAN